MQSTERRTFLKTAGVGVAALACGAPVLRAAQGDKVVVGLIGSGGMGSNHLRLLAARQDVELAYICDVDQERLAAAAKAVELASGQKAKTTGDLRNILDDQRVDAVFIATPDHWHTPAALLALDAGKHVYVEKPCSHNVREGRLLVDAAKRSGKHVQIGTQSRSTPTVQEAMERVLSGEIGDVLVAKAWNSQRRSSIGKSQPTDPPQQLDYDMWVGPAPMVPYRPNMLPSIWRWWYHFGCGDIGNDGVHDIDVACWGLGVDTHPTTVTCIGGKYFFDDDQQFPDTQYAVCEYAPNRAGQKKQLIFEQRIWSPYTQEGYENGAAFYGTKGMLIIGHSVGWKLYAERNKLVAEGSGSPDIPAHHQNFFDCIRGNASKPNADAMAGHLSATIVHLANIAARVGRVVRFDPQSEQILDDPDAGALVRRQYREHWATPKNA